MTLLAWACITFSVVAVLTATQLGRVLDALGGHRAANEAVRVCAAHTRDIVDGDDCLVCSLGDALAERDRLLDDVDRLVSERDKWQAAHEQRMLDLAAMRERELDALDERDRLREALGGHQ